MFPTYAFAIDLCMYNALLNILFSYTLRTYCKISVLGSPTVPNSFDQMGWIRYKINISFLICIDISNFFSHVA